MSAAGLIIDKHFLDGFGRPEGGITCGRGFTISWPERFQNEAARLLKGTPATYGAACAPYLLAILAEQRALKVAPPPPPATGTTEAPR